MSKKSGANNYYFNLNPIMTGDIFIGRVAQFKDNGDIDHAYLGGRPFFTLARTENDHIRACPLRGIYRGPDNLYQYHIEGHPLRKPSYINLEYTYEIEDKNQKRIGHVGELETLQILRHYLIYHDLASLIAILFGEDIPMLTDRDDLYMDTRGLLTKEFNGYYPESQNVKYLN